MFSEVWRGGTTDDRKKVVRGQPGIQLDRGHRQEEAIALIGWLLKDRIL